MSSSSSSSASVSYTAGVRGSQVTLNITKDGNRSLTLSRGSNPKTSSSVPVPVGQRKFPDGYVGPVNIPFCKVCYDAGLPVADYTDHFVKNQPGPGGKVVCPTLLAQKCLVCGIAGHTSSYCPLMRLLESQDVEKAYQEREKAKKENGGWETVGAKGQVTTAVKPNPRIEDIDSKKPAPAPAVVAPAVVAPVVKYGGSFGILAVDDSSDSEEEYKDVPKPVRKEAVPPPSTAEASKPLTWAQRAAAAAQKPVPVSSSSSSAASVIDTRFQLHAALCDNIQESKRAPKRVTHIPPPPQTEAMQQPVNARGAAAAVASESSKKRKQNAALVPA
jgi:hypothetical protein